MPRLSLIVAAQDSRLALDACLESLRQQQSSDQLEVIIANTLPERDQPTPAKQSSWHWINLPTRSSLPMLLGAGIAQASGDLIAITEGHCRFPPTWVDAVLAAHAANPTPVIGGAVEPGEELNGAALGLYFADYGQFMLPLRGGIVHELPGENVSFKRDVLDSARRNGTDFAHTGFWKTFFCQTLEQAGQPLISEPSIVTSYHRQLSLGQVIRRRWQHGRCFGGMRAESLSTYRRAILAVGGILLPALLTVRLLRNVWPKTDRRVSFIRTLPFTFVAILCWSLGEWYGNLFGAANACESL